jgi:hypothetical protein
MMPPHTGAAGTEREADRVKKMVEVLQGAASPGGTRGLQDLMKVALQMKKEIVDNKRNPDEVFEELRVGATGTEGGAASTDNLTINTKHNIIEKPFVNEPMVDPAAGTESDEEEPGKTCIIILPDGSEHEVNDARLIDDLKLAAMPLLNIDGDMLKILDENLEEQKGKWHIDFDMYKGVPKFFVKVVASA